MKRRISLLIAFVLVAIAFYSPGVSVALAAEDGSAAGEIKPAPWSGDWWSRKKGFMVNGWPGHKPSPFERYDQYVESITGQNPGAWAWEHNKKNHHYNPAAEDWEGHCNGWSAAAILTKEPRETKIRNGIVFETADQKAIVSEQYMNPYYHFYGHRNWGNPGDDPHDIYPDQFHKLLMEYIAGQKSAIVCDTSADNQVWNFPLFRFESSWRTGWLDDQKLKVTTKVYYADDGVKPSFIGCKWFATTYTYNLILDDNGNIESGKWTGKSSWNHPDFVWVPTADAPNPAGTVEENPNISPKFVKQIIEGSADSQGGVSSSPDMVVMEAGLNPNELFR